MTTRNVIFLLIAGAAILVLARCDAFAGTSSYRFRLKVDVQTPQGLRTGSSVIEVSGHRKFRLMSEEKNKAVWLTGEAVTIELPSGPVFALLVSKENVPITGDVTKALAPDLVQGTRFDIVAAIQALADSSAVGRKASLPRAHPAISGHQDPIPVWPIMVRFRDLNDPSTMEAVNPDFIGVSAVTAEVTEDPVTFKLEERLPWLRIHQGVLARTGSNELPAEEVQRLSVSDFTTRKFK